MYTITLSLITFTILCYQDVTSQQPTHSMKVEATTTAIPTTTRPNFFHLSFFLTNS